VVALTYRATVDVPARFRNSKAVGAVFGLTPSKYQSGESSRSGAISRCEMMRVMLYEAAQSMLRSKKWSWLKAWAMQIARRRGMKKAIVAILEADRTAPVKQRHTAKRIFERLRDEHGFTGGYTVVKDHVRIERARHFQRHSVRFARHSHDKCKVPMGG